MIEPLTAAREAMSRHAFADAVQSFEEADQRGELGADDLQLLAQAAWWSGDADAAIEAFERSFAVYLGADDPARAALAALRLCELYVHRLSFAIAGGWLARAERLLEDEPEGEAHAWLAFIHCILGLARSADLGAVLEGADHGLALARASGSRDAESMLLSIKGQALVFKGDWAEGLALVDEAATLAAAGILQPKTACDVYCLTIGTCRTLADYRRAGEWAEEADRWMGRRALRGYRGVCRAYRAELKRLRGAWSEAEEEARAACAELEAFRLLESAGFAHNEVGEVRLRMGDFAAAEEAFQRAHEFGRDPQPGWSLLLLAQGQVEEATASIARVLRGAPTGAAAPVAPFDGSGVRRFNPLQRSKLLAARVEIALAARDLPAARTAAEELEELAVIYASAVLTAVSLAARGALQLEEDDPLGAADTLERARRAWLAVDLPYEGARTRALLGRALAASGDAAEAERELKGALGTFERLGAARDVHLANELLRKQAEASGGPTERLTRTFMFTDIVGSTELARVLEDSWPELIRWHDRTLQEVVAAHGGEVVRHTGDGYFVAFSEAAAAVAVAVAIQRRLLEQRRDSGYAVPVRIGMHTTEAGRHGDDYAGFGVHLAARVAELAGADEIVLSGETLKEAGSDLVSVHDRRSVTIKGAETPLEVVTVAWR